MVAWIVTFFSALFASLFTVPLVIAASHRLRLLDLPDPSVRGESRPLKTHKVATPRLGGLAMVISFTIAMLFTDGSVATRSIYIGIFSFFLLGFVDDLNPISAKLRLLIQIVLAYYVVHNSGLSLNAINVFDHVLNLGPAFGTALSVFIIVGAVNAINMIDGMDGLAAGITLIGIVMLSMSHFLSTRDTWLLSMFTYALMGTLLGFLNFNSYPARVFMGDGGSNWLGFMVGIIMIFAVGCFSYNPEAQVFEATVPKIPLVTGILCLAIPILDTSATILFRALKRSHPFRADMHHLHHGLLKSGLSHRQAVLAIYFAAMGSAVLGLLPVAFPKYLIHWLPYLALPLLFFTIFAIKSERVWRGLARRSLSFRYLAFSDNKGWGKLVHHWERVNIAVVAVIFLLAPIVSGSTSLFHGQVSLAFIPVMLIASLAPFRNEGFMLTLITSLAGCVVLSGLNANILSIEFDGVKHSIQPIYNALFVFLGVSAPIFYILTFNISYAAVSPTDFLLLSIPLLCLLVPEPWQSQLYLTQTSARSLILFFALRTFLMRNRSIFKKANALMLFSLTYFALNGIWGMRVVY